MDHAQRLSAGTYLENFEYQVFCVNAKTTTLISHLVKQFLTEDFLDVIVSVVLFNFSLIIFCPVNF